MRGVLGVGSEKCFGEVADHRYRISFEYFPPSHGLSIHGSDDDESGHGCVDTGQLCVHDELWPGDGELWWRWLYGDGLPISGG